MMNRGQVWLMQTNGGDHPCLIISRNAVINKFKTATVALISSKKLGGPTKVSLTTKDGAAYNCAASLDSIFTVHIEELKQHLWTLAPNKMLEVDEAIRVSLGLPEAEPSSYASLTHRF